MVREKDARTLNFSINQSSLFDPLFFDQFCINQCGFFDDRYWYMSGKEESGKWKETYSRHD